jgi:hypothetical protein
MEKPMAEKPDEQVDQIIFDVTMGFISPEEAARRLNILEMDPARATCSTCRKFRNNICKVPGLPPRPEHPDSWRCENYDYRDPRDEAMPVDAVTIRNNKTRMFK